MTVRLAVPGDIEIIATMGALFFEEAGWSDVTSWDHASIVSTLRHLVSSDDGIALVVEVNGEIVGMAGALLYPMYFNLTHKTGQELFWWVSPEHRGGYGGPLLIELEHQAKIKGAKTFTMIALSKVRPEIVGRIYERRGYRASERSYIKVL